MERGSFRLRLITTDSARTFSFLATCDMMGTQYEDDMVATGYGGHLALPLMREAVEKWGSAMTEEQASHLHPQAFDFMCSRRGPHWRPACESCGTATVERQIRCFIAA